jgi:glutamine amidotransferase PdxT
MMRHFSLHCLFLSLLFLSLSTGLAVSQVALPTPESVGGNRNPVVSVPCPPKRARDQLDARSDQVIKDPSADVRSTSELKKTEGTLGSGTSKTRWYIVDSGIAGPTVLVVGGIHGNEPAGYRAAEQIRHWPIANGKLIVLPQLNRLGLAADTRWIPDFRNDAKQRDLNRNFPFKESKSIEPQTPLAEATWEFVRQHKPDWVFDLHEGFDFHRVNKKSVGSSVIAFPADEEIARGLVNVVNQDIKPEIQFDLLDESGPVKGSLARACNEFLDAKSFIFETTFKDQPISTRTRQHRLLVSTILQRIGVIEQDLVDYVAPTRSSGILQVGVFDADGASEASVVKVLDGMDGIYFSHLGPADIKPAILERFDVVLFPGGSGGKQGRAIGSQGRESIREFVDDGGGVVGICAGAYLCSSHYDWSLNLVNASVFNKTVDVPGKGKRSVWFRGPAADVKVEVTSFGPEAIGVSGTHKVRYSNGPILSPGSHPDLPAYQVLGFFRTENGIYEQQKNTMINQPAIVFSQYGKGRVLAISPHFESTKGLENAVINAIRFVRKVAETEGK